MPTATEPDLDLLESRPTFVFRPSLFGALASACKVRPAIPTGVYAQTPWNPLNVDLGLFLGYPLASQSSERNSQHPDLCNTSRQ
jgi:hypothetical protein